MSAIYPNHTDFTSDKVDKVTESSEVHLFQWEWVNSRPDQRILTVNVRHDSELDVALVVFAISGRTVVVQRARIHVEAKKGKRPMLDNKLKNKGRNEATTFIGSGVLRIFHPLCVFYIYVSKGRYMFDE